MKMKYVGMDSPIHLYQLEQDKKTIETGEVFECPDELASEFLKRFNMAGKPKKFLTESDPEFSGKKPVAASPVEGAKAGPEPDKNKIKEPSAKI